MKPLPVIVTVPIAPPATKSEGEIEVICGPDTVKALANWLLTVELLPPKFTETLTGPPKTVGDALVEPVDTATEQESCVVDTTL